MCPLVAAPLPGPAAETVAATLSRTAKGFPDGVSIKEAVDDYCISSLATLDTEVLDDVSEIEVPDEPYVDSDTEAVPSPADDESQM